MKLRFSEQAQADIERIDAWWAKRRPKNPLCFREELLGALEHIEATPMLAGYEYFPDEQLVAVATISSPVHGGPEL